MGKILTYLNISEENQTRGLLDAERLLEGMQAIYAASASGSKKDNFAVPLAEMTKIFIEKAKGIAPKEEVKEEPKQELNFKVGDRFTQSIGEDGQKELGINVFTILDIDEKNGKVKIYVKYDIKNNGKEKEFERDINKVIEDVDEKWWIPYEDEDSFKLGDKFYVTKEGDKKLYEVTYIDGQVFTFIKRYSGNIESYEGLYTTDEANNLLKEGRWTKFLDKDKKPKETPKERKQPKKQKPKEEKQPKEQEPREDFVFNVGDKYLNNTLNEILTIIKVNADSIDVEIEGFDFYYDINLANEKVADGTWVKITDEEKQDFPYKLSDEFYVPRLDEYFKITEISNDKVSFIYNKDSRKFVLDITEFLYNVNTNKTFVPVTKNYKVGDKFLWAKENMVFTIDFIKNGEVGIIYDDGLTGIMSTDQFEKGLSTGYYQPYTEQAQEETDLYFKIGDKFLGKYNNSIYLIENIDKNNNIVEYSILNKDGEKISANDGSISTIQDYIKRSDWIKYEEKDNTQPKRKKREPRVKSEQDKKIEHILDINIDEIQF
jgi:hypothetical protein